MQSDQIQFLWSQLRKAVREQTQQMNNGLVFDNLSGREFSVTKGTDNLFFRFHPDTSNIEIRQGNHPLDWLVVAKSHLDPSHDNLVSRKKNERVDPTSYAAWALNELGGGSKHGFLLLD